MRGRCRCRARWSSEPAARALVEPVRGASSPSGSQLPRHKRHELLALPPLTALWKTVLMQFGQKLHTGAMLVGLSFLLGGCASVSSTSNSSTLDHLLADPALNGATVSVMVRDARSGNTLYNTTRARGWCRPPTSSC